MIIDNKTNKKRENKMKNKTTNPYGIKTPEDVREFRENLKKYYVVHPLNRDVFEFGVNVEDMDINNLYLYVNTNSNDDDDNINTSSNYEIPLMDISTLDDLYELCDGEPMITPKMDMVKDKLEYMDETDPNNFPNISFHNYYSNENNFKIYETQEEFITEGEPIWYSLSNQLLREFYMMTLGDFSGYVDDDLKRYELSGIDYEDGELISEDEWLDK
jgi:hypothetical protein